MIKKPLRILVAEDNQMNLELVCYMLEQMNFDYCVAEDGAGAVDIFKKDHISLILMDCHMAGMDGFQATQEIRRIESEASDGRHVPIVALTAKAIMGDKKKCLEIGMDDYLSKPFKFDQLKGLLNKWLALENLSTALPGQDEIASDAAENNETPNVDFQSVEAVIKDPEIIKKLMRLYIEQTRLYIDDICSAADNNDRKKLKFAAHALKSSSATLGIKKVAQTCQEIEFWQPEKGMLSIPLLVSRLTEEFAAAVPVLQDYVKRLGE